MGLAGHKKACKCVGCSPATRKKGMAALRRAAGTTANPKPKRRRKKTTTRSNPPAVQTPTTRRRRKGRKMPTTLLVNPAPAKTTGIEPAKRRRRRRTRPNPLNMKSLVPLLLPVVMGGAVGALEARGPAAWRNLAPKWKGLAFAAIGVVLRRKGHPELYGAAMALGAAYLAQGLAGSAPTAKDLQDAADDEMNEIDDVGGYYDGLGDVDDDDEADVGGYYDGLGDVGALAHEELGALIDEIGELEVAEAA